LAMLAARMKPLQRRTSPFEDEPREARQGAVWIQPELVVELRFSERSSAGVFRHPVYLGLREDKSGREVEERPPALAKAATARAGSAGKAAMRITNPDKVLYPEAGYTKGRLAEHYAQAAERMLPFVAGRPLTLVRCPDGVGGQCFFQKHPHKGGG